MENVVKSHNIGVLPAQLPNDFEELQISESYSENEVTEENEEENSDEISAAEDEAGADKPYSHVRVPEIRRGSLRILMALAAACGAAAGAVPVFSGAADAAALNSISVLLNGTFGEIFLNRLIIGTACLTAEFLLGFFALGDWIVWTVPLFFSMGIGMRFAAAGSWALLPAAGAGVCAVLFAAAASAGFSQTLMRLSDGGIVCLESSPKRSYILKFLGYFAAVLAAAVYEGAIMNVTMN